MFICKSNNIINKYYESIFPWLKRCEEKFGFNLEGYGLKRIYGFLAERYMSYWFKKYTNYKTLPIIFRYISIRLKVLYFFKNSLNVIKFLSLFETNIFFFGHFILNFLSL